MGTISVGGRFDLNKIETLTWSIMGHCGAFLRRLPSMNFQGGEGFSKYFAGAVPILAPRRLFLFALTFWARGNAFSPGFSECSFMELAKPSYEMPQG
jgi:hypothetical protein